MRIGIAAGAGERCGVGDFARRLAAAYPPEMKVDWLAYPEGNTGAAWRRAARAAEGLDVVHVHYEYGLFGTVKPFRNNYSAFVANLAPPVVVTLHGPLPRLEPRWRSGRRRAPDLMRDLAYLPYFARWKRIMKRGVDHWIVHNRGLCDRTESDVGVGRCTYMPHPIPPVARRWQPGALRELVMVTPGFVKPHKGHVELARALATELSWSWIIAGGAQNRTDEEHLRRLREVLSARDIADRVRITGYLDRSDMEAILCGAAAAVFPFSDVAGSGSVAWAIGCGVPVVATDLAEFRLMEARGAGIELLPRDAPWQWAGILDRLWRGPARLEVLARRNCDYAMANGVDACAREHLAIFARLARGDGT